MAQSGSKSVTVKIDAPIIVTTDGTPVWGNEKWPMKFFDWLDKNGFRKKLSGFTHMNNKLKLSFIDSKSATMFGLKYDREKEKKIF